MLQEHSGRILHPAFVVRREIPSLKKWVEIGKLKGRNRAKGQYEKITEVKNSMMYTGDETRIVQT